jgi:tetratricopeptide (TPR) repeat protein
MSRKHLLTFLTTLLISGSAHAQLVSKKIERGVVIERLITVERPDQSYAVYLPTGYDSKNKYPAIFAFDASGRGSRAVGIYTQAAEKYGYLVFASNNSRNGLDAASLTTALNAIWNDANTRFSIDTARVLATGNSGGARVASVFAYSCKCIFGVMGAGAGFYQGLPTNKPLPFLFLGTTGKDDFNYPEVWELAKKLSKAGVVNHVLVFDGGHQWPPPDVVDKALAWYELQQMKMGRRARDERFLDEMLAQRTEEAEQLLTKRDLFQAGYAFRSIISDFEPLRPISHTAVKLSALEDTSEYKKAAREEADEIKQQRDLVAQLMSAGNESNDPTPASTFGHSRDTIRKLHLRAASTANSSDRRVARRALNDIFVAAFETALYAHEPQGNYTAALTNLELAAEASPKFASIPYNQARIFALKGDKKKSLAYLQKAIELGFKNAVAIENEKAFESIRLEEQFVKLLSLLPR